MEGREAEYEVVHTVTDYYDGPRRGIADFEGKPHLYESQWDEEADEWESSYRLSPVDEETFRLAMEDWAIWRRWEAAFHEGRTTLDTHPALPEDRERHEELENFLEEHLVLDGPTAIRARADFKAQAPPSGELGERELIVRWRVVTA